MKEKLTAYLTLSRKERNGVLLLGILIIFLFILPPMLPVPASPPPKPADTAWIVAMKKLEQKGASYPQGAVSSFDDPGHPRPPARSGYGSPASTGTSSLFAFDPNTLNEAGWQQLGRRPAPGPRSRASRPPGTGAPTTLGLIDLAQALRERADSIR